MATAFLYFLRLVAATALLAKTNQLVSSSILSLRRRRTISDCLKAYYSTRQLLSNCCGGHIHNQPLSLYTYTYTHRTQQPFLKTATAPHHTGSCAVAPVIPPTAFSECVCDDKDCVFEVGGFVLLKSPLREE